MLAVLLFASDAKRTKLPQWRTGPALTLTQAPAAAKRNDAATLALYYFSRNGAALPALLTGTAIAI